jgi:hypothetical protein
LVHSAQSITCFIEVVARLASPKLINPDFAAYCGAALLPEGGALVPDWVVCEVDLRNLWGK